ncbi:MAG: vitamin B12-dependent ribonucleotide reductase [bacterium]
MSADTNVSTNLRQPTGSRNSMTSLKFQHHFSNEGAYPFDQLEWELRDAQITNEKGEVIFEQKAVEMPKHFTQLATNVVVSKYFKGTMNTPERENSLRQVVGRVANTITDWGIKDSYFASDEDAETYRSELTALLVNQYMAFNSPVWFNVGVEEYPQCSACFINSVEDKMESILDLAKTEGMLFKFGSGTGSNLSPLRSSFEGMSGGGQASGPVSFMKGFDAFAGVIKSGGKTRRAAKMVILNVDHPDIIDFIDSKVKEERKAHALIKMGYEADFNGEAYSSIFFQNANHSVRVTDEFMRALEEDREWETRAITTGKVVETHKTSDIMKRITEAAWETGDPGLQFDTTINEWHTCPSTARINASNPCSEYMFLDDSACNLASLNLMKFRREDGSFDIELFRAAVRITITAQEIIVGNASYPTPAIARNSYDFRPLGLGYANLGALLMSLGLPYDSAEGRAYSATVTALMHGEACRTSAEIAGVTGPFKYYKKNRRPFLRVMHKHADAVSRIDSTRVPKPLLEAVEDVYTDMLQLGEKNGFRNAQTTVLAPTGTIAFMMDCDTTGIEPDIALVKYKKLVGGGMLKIVNRTVPLALKTLGYNAKTAEEVVHYIEENDTIEGAPGLKPEHLPVFDCAFKPFKGDRSIHYMGHVRMMAAVQPFLSGAISKTVNMPNSATTEDIRGAYSEAWKLGLKAIAIYRDGCKASQPLSTKTEEKAGEAVAEKKVEVKKAARRKLPDERKSITHKFSVGGHEGYVTVGAYEDGKPGEIFIVMSKEGSAISGLMDSFATSVSIALQYGVPLSVLVRKFIHTRFEPSGFTNNRQIPIAHSVMDYLFRWLALKFLPPEEHGISTPDEELDTDLMASDQKAIEAVSGDGNGHGNGNGKDDKGEKMTVDVMREAQRVIDQVEREEHFVAVNQSDAPPCTTCGSIMVRSGSCYKCLNCGTTSGCS